VRLSRTTPKRHCRQRRRRYHIQLIPESNELKELLERSCFLPTKSHRHFPERCAITLAQSNELKELLEISREYVTAIRLKNMIGELGPDDVVRSTELSAYFTHCNLQPAHLLLALNLAMTAAFRAKVGRSCRSGRKRTNE
jgi:hypothetical protein